MDYDAGSLAEQVAAAQWLASQTPFEDERYWLIQSLLGTALFSRYEAFGDPADLDRAITAITEAASCAPNEDRSKPHLLATLGYLRAERHKRTGNPDDLNAAVQVRDVARLHRPDGDSGLMSEANLAIALHERYQTSGSSIDLDEAIDVGEHVITALPADHKARSLLLGHVAEFRLARYSVREDPQDLIRALTLASDAVDRMTDNANSRCSLLLTMTRTLLTSYRATGAAEHLDEAVWFARRALEHALSVDERNVANAELSGVLLERYKRSSNSDDLEESVACAEQSVLASPVDHPSRTNFLISLGLALSQRYLHSRSKIHLHRTIRTFVQATQVEAAPPRSRVHAAQIWGAFSALLGDWQGAVAGYEVAISLLKLIVPPNLTSRDQEQALRPLAGLGEEAAAACLMWGDATRAVQLLEQSRGVLLTQRLNLREDISGLAVEYPDLADAFLQLRTLLDSPWTAVPNPGETQDGLVSSTARVSAEDRAQAARQLDLIIHRIREEAGRPDFLMPPELADLLPATLEGPVVIVNVSNVRSDALILTPLGVDPLPLPSVTAYEVHHQVQTLLQAIERIETSEGSDDTAAERQLCDVLVWTWRNVTGPVLSRLGCAASLQENQRRPRVYWCPSGPSAFLPLHAALDDPTKEGPRPKALDLVTSSYTPTLRALMHSRRPPPPSRTSPRSTACRLLVVAAPAAPEVPPLPHATREALALAKRIPADRVTILGLPSYEAAKHETVITELSRHNWAHFACHAMRDHESPTLSRLILEDHLTKPLAVQDIAALDLPDAEFAFLSACSTGQPDLGLPDEAVHLATGFQAAGFRSIVATLWPVRDEDAARVAEQVYDRLVTGGAGASGSEPPSAAEALRLAASEVMAAHPDEPSRWAGFYHQGF